MNEFRPVSLRKLCGFFIPIFMLFDRKKEVPFESVRFHIVRCV